MRISRKKRPQKKLIPDYNINARITVPEVRVLDSEGKNLDVMTTQAAKNLATQQGLDLVEINPKANPPVVQIIDFTHFKYQKEKEARKQRTHAHVSDTKGIRLSMRISQHDMDFRREQAHKFLDRGDKVKIELIMRGRENAKPTIGFDILKKFVDGLREDMGIKYEQEPERQGNRLTAIIVKK